MTTTVYGAVGVVVAAIVAGLVTWAVARRGSSGRIDTSQAATLWEESTAMRGELRDQVATLTTVVLRLTTEAETTRATLADLRDQVGELRTELAAKVAEISKLIQERGKP